MKIVLTIFFVLFGLISFSPLVWVVKEAIVEKMETGSWGLPDNVLSLRHGLVLAILEAFVCGGFSVWALREIWNF